MKILRRCWSWWWSCLLCAPFSSCACSCQIFGYYLSYESHNFYYGLLFRSILSQDLTKRVSQIFFVVASFYFYVGLVYGLAKFLKHGPLSLWSQFIRKQPKKSRLYLYFLSRKNWKWWAFKLILRALCSPMFMFDHY